MLLYLLSYNQPHPLHIRIAWTQTRPVQNVYILIIERLATECRCKHTAETWPDELALLWCDIHLARGCLVSPMNKTQQSTGRCILGDGVQSVLYYTDA